MLIFHHNQTSRAEQHWVCGVPKDGAQRLPTQDLCWAAKRELAHPGKHRKARSKAVSSHTHLSWRSQTLLAIMCIHGHTRQSIAIAASSLGYTRQPANTKFIATSDISSRFRRLRFKICVCSGRTSKPARAIFMETTRNVPQCLENYAWDG